MRPRRLSMFLQIFIWFWAAMALLAISVVAVELTTRQEPLALASNKLAQRTLRIEARRVHQIWKQGGKAAVAAELRQFDAETGVQSFLIDSATGKDLLDRPLPHGLPRLVSNVRPADEAQWAVAGLFVQVALPAGPDTVFAARFERGPFAARRSTRFVRLLAVVLTAGLVCWFLAARFTRPIGMLRTATRELASGNLGARVALQKAGAGDELTGLANDFNAMAVQIESLVGAQKRLVGDVSHELRSPLTRLKIALALANRDAPSTAPLQDHLGRIEQEAATLDELIGELLLLSRLENRLDPQSVARFDWAAVVAEVAADLDWEAQNRPESVQIIRNFAVEHVFITGEAALLKRALENVARNALRYAPPEGSITVSLERAGECWVTSVRDTGPGVPESELEAIFRPFYRVDTARERDSQTGTGLGLAIASRAVQLHGGTIRARNLAPRGFEVEIKLPAEGA